MTVQLPVLMCVYVEAREGLWASSSVDFFSFLVGGPYCLEKGSH